MRSFFDLLRREIDTEGLIPISSDEWETMIKEYRTFAMNCSEATNREICDQRLNDYKETFRDLVRLRVYKAIKTGSLPEDSLDKPFLSLILRLIDDFVSSLDEVISDERGKVFVIAKRKIEFDKTIVEPNELIMMNLMEAVALSAFGYVELLRLPVEASERFSWITAEKVRV